MAEIIDFPTTKSSNLSPELTELFGTISTRINRDLTHPDLSIQGNLDDPNFPDLLEEKLTKNRDE